MRKFTTLLPPDRLSKMEDTKLYIHHFTALVILIDKKYINRKTEDKNSEKTNEYAAPNTPKEPTNKYTETLLTNKDIKPIMRLTLANPAKYNAFPIGTLTAKTNINPIDKMGNIFAANVYFSPKK